MLPLGCIVSLCAQDSRWCHKDLHKLSHDLDFLTQLKELIPFARKECALCKFVCTSLNNVEDKLGGNLKWGVYHCDTFPVLGDHCNGSSPKSSHHIACVNTFQLLHQEHPYIALCSEGGPCPLPIERIFVN